MTAINPFSLHRIAYVLAGGVAIWLVVNAMFALWLASNDSATQQTARQQLAVDGYAKALARQLAVYQDVLQGIAGQPTTQDILDKSDRSGAERLALQMRRFIPQASGAFLITANGQVLGEPSATHYTDRCLADLARLMQNPAASRTLVHGAGISLHTDLAVPVLDDSGSVLGALVITLEAELFTRTLQAIASPEERLELLGGGSKTLAAAGMVAGEAASATRAAVPGSDWTLRMVARRSADVPDQVLPALANLLLALLIGGVMIYTLRSRRTEPATLTAAPAAASEPQPPTESATTTDEALDVVRRDELTGLPNKTVFQEEFARAYHFARRGHPVAVAFMEPYDMDELHTKSPVAARRSLKLLGNVLRRCCRKTDLAARVEGNRFGLLLYSMKPERIDAYMAKLQDQYLSAQQDHREIGRGEDRRLTYGYTYIDTHRDFDMDSIIERAMYALTANRGNDETEDWRKKTS